MSAEAIPMVRKGLIARPPYRMTPPMQCAVCGFPAIAFWPGRYVEHTGGVACLIGSGERVQLPARDVVTGAAA